MRRLVATALCLVPLAASAGCGGSSSGAKSPLDDALGYLPSSAPVVVAVDTNLKDAQWKSLTTNVQKFPFAGQVDSTLKGLIAQQGLDFDKDIEPLLGNQVAIGVPTVQMALANNGQVVAALKVKDAGKLSALLAKRSSLQKDGTSHGATLYRSVSGRGETAQKGPMLLSAATKQQLVAALEQRERSDRLREDNFNGKLTGLPSDALVRLYVDARALISGSPAAAVARRVKWVAALGTVALTASSQSNGISIDFDAKTDPSKLSNSDLPIAAGDASPPVSVKPGDVGIAIRGLDQIERFGEAVAQVADPPGYARFLSDKRRLGSSAGVNLDRDLIRQLSGNSSESFDTSGHFALRATPKNPAAFARALAKVARAAPSLPGFKGSRITSAHGLYKLTGRDGKSTYYGMVGNVFAASNDPARVAQIAAQPPQAVAGAHGAVALSADAAKLAARIVSKRAGGGLGGAFGGSLFSAPLGNLSGWASSSTSGIKGHLGLEIR